MQKGWVAIVAWQLGSCLLTATGFFSQRLAQLGVDAPTAQSALAYILLATHMVPLLWQKENRSQTRWWQWLLIAAADVEANYLLVLAYQYTDITSVCILDAFTIPTVMLLSRMLFRVRYSWHEVLAAALCLVGITILFASDLLGASVGAGEGHPQAWLGDTLVLLGAALYGCSNVAQEYLLRHVIGRVEYLGHLGMYGAAIAVVQSALLEAGTLQTIWRHVSAEGMRSELLMLGALEAGFVMSLCGFYVLVAALLEGGSSATLMNLSLLTSDFWSVAIGVTLLHSTPGLVYAGAFALVVSGLGLYHCSQSRREARGLAQPLVASGADPDTGAGADVCICPSLERHTT
jgi:solute carrier family 35 protein F1/2